MNIMKFQICNLLQLLRRFKIVRSTQVRMHNTVLAFDNRSSARLHRRNFAATPAAHAAIYSLPGTMPRCQQRL